MGVLRLIPFLFLNYFSFMVGLEENVTWLAVGSAISSGLLIIAIVGRIVTKDCT